MPSPCSIPSQAYRLSFDYQPTALNSGGSGGTTNNVWSVSIGPLVMGSGTSPSNNWSTDYGTFTCSSTPANNLLSITLKSGTTRTTTVNFDNFLALPLGLAW
jgi:hypothetical protein